VIIILKARVAICVTVFAVLLTGGWMTERRIQHHRAAGLYALPAEDVTIIHTYEMYYPVFRSREYVKIVRLPAKTDKTRQN
jgi:hypothetical protein